MELHLEDVLEVLLVVGVEFLPYETCIVISNEDSLENYDDWFINGGDTLILILWGKKKVIEVWATKYFIKDKITGRVDILWSC